MGERLGAGGVPGRGGGLAEGLCPAPRGGCRPASFQNTSWLSTPFPPPAGFQKLRQLVLAPSWVQTLSEGGTGASKNSGPCFMEGQAQMGAQVLQGRAARPQRGAGAQAKCQSVRRGLDAGPGAPAASQSPGLPSPRPTAFSERRCLPARPPEAPGRCHWVVFLGW